MIILVYISMNLSNAINMVLAKYPNWPRDGASNYVMSCVRKMASMYHQDPHEILGALLAGNDTDLYDSTIFWDWREVVESETVDGHEIMIIPKNTALFHGTDLNFPKVEIPRDLSYFANLVSASNYAFRTDKQSANDGQLLAFMTKRPLHIFKMTPSNIKKLQSTYPDNFPLKEFQAAYGYGKDVARRQSHVFTDAIIQQWWCEKNIPFDGIGNNTYIGFHGEISLCRIQYGDLRRLPFRYSFDYEFPECVMYIEDGSDIITAYPLKPFGGFVKWNRVPETKRQDEQARIKELDKYAPTNWEFEPTNPYFKCGERSYGQTSEYVYPTNISA